MRLAFLGMGSRAADTSCSGSLVTSGNSSALVGWIEEALLAIDGDLFPN